MGFWKSFFGGEPENPEEEKKNAEDKNFDGFKYDGVKAMRMGQFDYAERCFREAMKIKDDLEVNDYLSQTLMRLGRLDEALAEMRIMINAQPSNAALLLQAAHVAYMLEDYDEARALYDKLSTTKQYGDASTFFRGYIEYAKATYSASFFGRNLIAISAAVSAYPYSSF